MSRIGRLPISVPAGVEVKIDGNVVAVKGPKGELSREISAPITVAQNDGEIVVSRPNDERESRSLCHHAVTGTNDFELLSVAFGDTDDHVVDQGA